MIALNFNLFPSSILLRRPEIYPEIGLIATYANIAKVIIAPSEDAGRTPSVGTTANDVNKYSFRRVRAS